MTRVRKSGADWLFVNFYWNVINQPKRVIALSLFSPHDQIFLFIFISREKLFYQFNFNNF